MQITLGTYNGKKIRWSLIRNGREKSLYLCDELLKRCHFGESNDYMRSEVRNVCLDIFEQCFTDEEKKRLYIHPEIGDPVFLLRKKEYIEYRNVVKKCDKRWWLRSPGNHPNCSSGVDFCGGVYSFGVFYAFLCIRPAILVNRT